MNVVRLASGAVLIGVVAFASVAQERLPIRPGLWEVRSSTAGSPTAGPEDMKVCYTAEQLARGFSMPESSNCKLEVTNRTTSAWKWRSSCEQPGMKMSSEGETQFAGDTAFTNRITMNLQRQGQAPVVTQAESKGKWLAADCGSVKPAPKPG